MLARVEFGLCSRQKYALRTLRYFATSSVCQLTPWYVGLAVGALAKRGMMKIFSSYSRFTKHGFPRATMMDDFIAHTHIDGYVE